MKDLLSGPAVGYAIFFFAFLTSQASSAEIFCQNLEDGERVEANRAGLFFEKENGRCFLQSKLLGGFFNCNVVVVEKKKSVCVHPSGEIFELDDRGLPLKGVAIAFGIGGRPASLLDPNTLFKYRGADQVIKTLAPVAADVLLSGRTFRISRARDHVHIENTHTGVANSCEEIVVTSRSVRCDQEVINAF